MKKIYLDGVKIKNQTEAFEYFLKELEAPNYFFPSLESFWDYLLTVNEPVEIWFKNVMAMYLNINGYAESILELFIQAEKRNKNIKFTYEE